MPRCLAIALLLLSALAFPAGAETTNCTNITSLPAVISTQGVYCLKQDLSTAISSGAAITINSNNVTIDCNDWKLGGLAGGAGTTANGIVATNRRNITIRNCGIRGFRYGIDLDGIDGAYHLVEDNRIDLSTYRGIVVWGSGTTIRRNRVYDTGGTGGQAYGITTVGASLVDDNIVHGASSSGASVLGIYLNSLGDASFASRNRISGLSQGTYTYGIYTNDSVSMFGNMVTNTSPPAETHYGIICLGGVGQGVSRDSVLVGFNSPANPVSDCTSVGTTAP